MSGRFLVVAAAASSVACASLLSLDDVTYHPADSEPVADGAPHGTDAATALPDFATDARPSAPGCVPRVTCDAGCGARCPVPSPLSGDELLRVAARVDGVVWLQNREDCALYECRVAFDSPDSFDCSRPPQGTWARTCSVSGPPCNGTFTVSAGALIACGGEMCSYTCRIVP